jgi:lipopolysaccharide transport system ATP-binding protein
MIEPVISVDKISKRFRIGERERYVALRDVLTRAVVAPFRRNKRRSIDYLWALSDVSFDVHEGEVIGLIGNNGAGKTTLLKILSRITRPTGGYAEIRGRIGSLLEVGTGFHPELTGRENVYLSGAILGMGRHEINRKFDEIVSFAEVARFLDMPLKHYSSGMQMRLAFAVAAHLEPEILLVDEVLAVGDAAFQKRCMAKMGEVSRQGRTIVFVSHNMTAVERLCHKAFCLEKGTIVASGTPKEMIRKYLNTLSTVDSEKEWHDVNSAAGNEKVRLRSARVRPLEGNRLDSITVHTPFVMEIEYWNLKADARINLSLSVYTEDGVLAFATGPIGEPVWNGKPFPVALFRSACHVPGDFLNDGVHRLCLLVVEDQGRIIYKHEDLLAFEVHEDVGTRGGWLGDWPGATRPMLRWTTEMVSPVSVER